MARIRSIHPNTPTDPDLAAIPIPGRLLFIYSWTIADDAGNFERNPRGMKMALFPGDDKMTVSRIANLTEELIATRFYVPYEVAGRTYLHVRSFQKYQKPERPTSPRFPLFPGQQYSYYAKEGNVWIQKKISSEFGEHALDVRRTDSERTPVIRAGVDLESERRGKEVDLDLEGMEHALPSPPSGGGGAAAPEKDNGNGRSVGEERAESPTLDFVDSLPKPKRDALRHAVERFNGKEWSRERVNQHLLATEFEDQELRAAGHLFVSPEVPR